MNIYLLSKKIHRLLVVLISFSIILMTATGLMMKYPRITNVIPFNLVSVRTLHNLASPIFSIILVLMMVTGIIMYFYPVLTNRKSKTPEQPQA